MTRSAVLTTRRTTWRRANLVAVTALTVYSTAIGWQAQLVSYPLYRAVGAADFPAYHLQYNASIPVVTIAPGFLSFLGCIAFWWTRPADVPRPVAGLVALSGLTALLSTVLWAIRRHDQLDEIGQSGAVIDSLLDANLLRSVALTAGALALLGCVVRRPGPAAPEKPATGWS